MAQRNNFLLRLQVLMTAQVEILELLPFLLTNGRRQKLFAARDSSCGGLLTATLLTLLLYR